MFLRHYIFAQRYEAHQPPSLQELFRLYDIFHIIKISTTSCDSLPDCLTIADLDASDELKETHILEALHFRAKV